MKKISIFAAALCFVALASCTKDNGNGVEPFGKETWVDVVIEDSSKTRAASTETVNGTDAENYVEVLEFFVFDDNGSTLDDKVDATHHGYWKVEVAELKNKANWPWKQQLKMSAGSSKQILVVANASIGAPDTWTPKGVTFDDVVGKITDAAMVNKGSNPAPNVRVVPTTGFEMSGFVLDANVVADQSNNPVAVSLSRLVSKIVTPVATGVTVELTQEQIEEAFGDATTVVKGDAITFTQTGWAVINGIKQSSVAFAGRLDEDDETITNGMASRFNYKKPYDATPANAFPWSNWTEASNKNGDVAVGAFEKDRGDRIRTNAKDIVNGIDDTAWSGAYSGMDEQNQTWFLSGGANENAVYAYESKPGTKTATGTNISGFDPDYVTAFIIRGTLAVGSKSATATRYWRVNIYKDDSYHFMRNSVYQTTITKIVTPGYETPEEAETEPPIIVVPGETAVQFTIDVLPWDVNKSSVEM